MSLGESCWYWWESKRLREIGCSCAWSRQQLHATKTIITSKVHVRGVDIYDVGACHRTHQCMQKNQSN